MQLALVSLFPSVSLFGRSPILVHASVIFYCLSYSVYFMYRVWNIQIRKMHTHALCSRFWRYITSAGHWRAMPSLSPIQSRAVHITVDQAYSVGTETVIHIHKAHSCSLQCTLHMAVVCVVYVCVYLTTENTSKKKNMAANLNIPMVHMVLRARAQQYGQTDFYCALAFAAVRVVHAMCQYEPTFKLNWTSVRHRSADAAIYGWTLHLALNGRAYTHGRYHCHSHAVYSSFIQCDSCSTYTSYHEHIMSAYELRADGIAHHMKTRNNNGPKRKLYRFFPCHRILLLPSFLPIIHLGTHFHMHIFVA